MFIKYLQKKAPNQNSPKVDKVRFKWIQPGAFFTYSDISAVSSVAGIGAVTASAPLTTPPSG